MRMETRTWDEEYRMFDVGERIRPQATSRAPLLPGVYTVTRCEPPLGPMERGAWVWVEGRQHPVQTTYLTAAEEPDE